MFKWRTRILFGEVDLWRIEDLSLGFLAWDRNLVHASRLYEVIESMSILLKRVLIVFNAKKSYRFPQSALA